MNPGLTVSSTDRCPTVACIAPKAILSFCEKHRVPRRSLRGATGMVRRMSIPAGRLPYDRVAALWEEAASCLNEPAIGVKVSRSIPFLGYGILDVLMACAPTALVALETASQHHDIVNEGLTLDLVRRRRHVELIIDASRGIAPSPQYVEFVCSNILYRSRTLTPGGWGATEVHFSHRPFRESDSHAGLMGLKVSFGAPVNRIRFELDALEQPQPSADPVLFEEILCRVKEWIARRTFDQALEGTIASAIRGASAGTTARLDEVARRAGMSRRSLQRALLRSGTSFRWTLDTARARLAINLLSIPGTNVTDIAAFLGFSEPSPFYRAFRRWTGRTPRLP